MAQIGDLVTRPCTLDDAEAAARIWSARTPDDPSDPDVVRAFWEAGDSTRVRVYEMIELDGMVVGTAAIEHPRWELTDARFVHLGACLHPDQHTDQRYDALLADLEARAAADGGRVATRWLREHLTDELEVLRHRGYTLERTHRWWELDLAERGPAIRELCAESRTRMAHAGIEVTTVSTQPQPDVYRELYAAMDEQLQDEPTSVPYVSESFETFMSWADGPAAHADRIWVARLDGRIVGCSMLTYPPNVGNVWTGWTGTQRSVRGRGVARALKLETLVQAMDLGITRVLTANDGANEPILHLNEQLGYRPFPGSVEMHKTLPTA